MKASVLTSSGRAPSAADLMIDVCLSLTLRPTPSLDPCGSRSKTRGHSARGRSPVSADTILGSITASVVATPHRVLVRMHLLPASRG